MRALLSGLFAALLLLTCSAASAQDTRKRDPAAESSYSKGEVIDAATRFFGGAAEGIAQVVEKAFADHGRPNAYIQGEEASGAIGVGLRYGQGRLVRKSGAARSLFWQGPSIGLDIGGNASKVFVLVYNLGGTNSIFQRFPGVEGSYYVVAGVGMHYMQSGRIILAPIRTGVGLRAGVNMNYIHITPEKSINPF